MGLARSTSLSSASAASLPDLSLLVLSDRRQAARLGVEATVAAAVAGGVRTVILREKDRSHTERVDLGRTLVELLAPVGGSVILAGADAELAATMGAGGLHLASSDALPVDRGELVIGRSCHTEAELRGAMAEGADYVTVSPVFASLSKPGYGPALGTAGLAALAAAATVPVVALGGITPANAGTCLVAGAAGVAVMGAVMRAGDPTGVTAALVAVLAGASPAETAAPAVSSPTPEATRTGVEQ